MVNCPNCEAEVAEDIKFCTECGSKIEHIHNKQEINSETTCPSCSAQLPAETKFCMECGTKIEKQNYLHPNQEIICHNCSVENPAGTRFCTSCGTKLEVGFNPNQEVTCPKCSTELPPGTRFCTDCGTKFEQNSSIKPQENIVSDDTVNNVKEAGRGLMKEAGGLFSKATSKGGFFDKVAKDIDESINPKTKTVFKKCLICNKCGGYYELQEGESPKDFDLCECGGKLKYQLKQEKIQLQ
ncbi:MAG: zinc-ribbon domain-containing protein [Methanobacterium sp.]